jgi:hypothetical protein
VSTRVAEPPKMAVKLHTAIRMLDRVRSVVRKYAEKQGVYD